MGVDYTAVLMVGRDFDSAEEAADFLRRHGVEIPGNDSEEMEAGLSEYLYSTNLMNGLDFERLNYYSSWDGDVLGWHVSTSEPEKFLSAVSEAIGRWKTLFNEESYIIHTVKVP